MPVPLVPVAVPVEVTDNAPVPLLSPKMPDRPPVLLLAATVRFVPDDELRASMPWPLIPVAVPVEVTDVVPVPLLRA